MPKLDTDKARQGKKGTPVLLVLIVALVLCVVLFLGFGAAGWFQSQPDLSNSGNASEVSTPATAGSSSDAVVTPDGTDQPAAAQ